jgi:hypothetical protein
MPGTAMVGQATDEPKMEIGILSSGFKGSGLMLLFAPAADENYIYHIISPSLLVCTLHIQYSSEIYTYLNTPSPYES